MEALKLRIFLSSPGDVKDERHRAREVLRKLGDEWPFKGKIELEAVSWDDPDQALPLDAHLTPQEAINRAMGKPSDCDVTVVILWSRMGTPLPDDIKRPDGSSYRSGTEYEFLDAIASADKTGKPSVWLYRRDEEPKLGMDDPEFDEKRRQWTAVKEFFAQFKEENGAIKRTVHTYSSPAAFQALFEGHLRDRISKRLQKSGVSAVSNGNGDPANIRNAVDTGNAVASAEELKAYRDASLSLHSAIPLAGFKTKLRVPIDLEDLHVPLHAMVDLRASGDCNFADASDAAARLHEHGTKELPLADGFREAKARNRRGLVILGDPGSGKTTHLKRLLLACLRENPETLGLHKDTIPVFLPLRELDDLRDGIDAFIEDTLASPHLQMSAGFGARLLKRGRLLLLFDGLDEVSDPGKRSQVARWIEQAAMHRPDCTAVVTCRFAGYDEASRLDAQFLELHLRPMTPEQSANFIRNWYRAVETGLAVDPSQGEIIARQRADEVIERLQAPEYRSARMAEMTRNPLLLANLCLVHRDRGALPRNRHQLYDECIEVLLERWREAKNLQVRVPAQAGRRILQPAALWLHGEEGRTRATAEELSSVMEPTLTTTQWSGGDAATFLRFVRDDSGLLTGWGPDQFGFMHLGFQEYLAATELRRLAFEGDKDREMRELASHYGESWWQEVILLLLAQGNPSLFVPFMREAIPQPAFVTDASLLALIMEEAAEMTTEPFEDWLKRSIDRAPPPEDTAEWQRIVTVVGVLRQKLSEEVFDRLLTELRQNAEPSMGGRIQERFLGRAVTTEVSQGRQGGVELVAIPGGSFLMGSPKGQGGNSEYPQHEVAVKPFYLGRYPVTNEEYRRYLQANPGVKEPEYWADRRFNQARQPVVGVDWEEARRFCEWAGGRLPTEAEWEYACRAGTTTEYLWGKKQAGAADYAWFGEYGAKGSNHAVGEKQPNPWGLHDMTGNVWEWQQDVWHDSYEGAPADGTAWTTGDSNRRVARGGSWLNFPAFLRSAYRSWYDPDDRFNDLGFRLAQDY